MDVSRILVPSENFIIAEIAQNHDGSLGICHAYIDALADAGADAIKFQTHLANAESTLDEPFRIKFSEQDATRYDYWRRMEFSEEQWANLKRHADARGIIFLSTPFSSAAVALLDRIGTPAWKVGSGDVMADHMIAPILATGKPLIVSTGMSCWTEIDGIASRLSDCSARFALMQCTSKYPTPLNEVGLNVLDEMRRRYACRIGLSDHSGTPTAAMVAMARGFGLIEVHATFDRRMFGPDVGASLTVDEIKGLVGFAREMREIDANPIDKDDMAERLQAQKTLFGRSVALWQDRPAGYKLQPEDLTPKKPGGGIPWSERGSVIGRILRRDVSANRLMRLEDIE